MKKDVIIALDFPGKIQCLDFLEQFKTVKPFVKIGMELYYSEGPSIVKELKDRGYKIFLDLKLHDIPNTVKKTMTVLAGLSADIVNVHASGTYAMMKAAVEGAEEGAKAAGKSRPLIIAVTQLTSTSEDVMQKELLINEELKKTVIHYAVNAKKAELDGVVCSPLESPLIHKHCGNEFLTITPGVRFADGSKGDQVRVTTPEKAGELGSNYIVVGRAITQNPCPVEAYTKCMKEFGGTI